MAVRVEVDETAVNVDDEESRGVAGSLKDGRFKDDTEKWASRGTPWIYEASGEVRREYPIFPI